MHLQTTPVISTGIQFKKIAVLSDFSASSDLALQCAADFARPYGAALVLAHAYLPPNCAYAAPDVALTFKALEQNRQALEDRLAAQTHADFLRGIKCGVECFSGSPSDLLRTFNDIDLIVVGTSGASGLRKTAMGSVAETIFRRSTIPVMTVGSHYYCEDSASNLPRTILYATDFSESGEHALPYAASIAARQQARLVLLHVARDRDADFTFERTMASAVPLERLHSLADAISADGHTSAPNRQVECNVGFGDAASVIADEARKCSASLIVLGSTRIGALAALASHGRGGTAYRVAIKAQCPVLTVPYA